MGVGYLASYAAQRGRQVFDVRQKEGATRRTMHGWIPDVLGTQVVARPPLHRSPPSLNNKA